MSAGEISSSFFSPIFSYFVSEPVEEGDDVGNGSCFHLKDRICPFIKAAPAIMVLATCVMAVICALIWKQYSLAIAFSIGTAGAAYGLYVSFEFSNLESFKENNEKLSDSIRVLQDENQILKKTRLEFTEKLTQMEFAVKDFEQKNGQLGISIETLGRENAELKETTEGLEKQVEGLTSIQQTAEKELASIQEINSSLTEIQSSASSDHKEFKGKLETLHGHLQTLQSIHSQFESTGSQVESVFQGQLSALTQTANLMTQTFEAIARWKDDQKISQELDRLEQLQRIQQSTLEEQKRVQQELGELKASIAFAKGQLEGLGKIQERFDAILIQFSTSFSEFKGEKEEFSKIKEEIQKATDIFKEFRRRSAETTSLTQSPKEERKS